MKKKLKAIIIIMIVIFFIPTLLNAEGEEVGSSTPVGYSTTLMLTLPSDMYLFGFSSDDSGSNDISGSTVRFSYYSHNIGINGYSYLGKAQFSVYWKVASRLNIRLILDSVPEGLSDGNSIMKFVQMADGTRMVLSSGKNIVTTINSSNGVSYGVVNYSAFISMDGVKKSNSNSNFTAQLTLKVEVI